MKKIFVGCSAYDTIDTKYFDEAKKVAELLVTKDLELVFGSYNKGLMGVMYHTFKEHNKSITGICAKCFEKFYNSVDCNRKLVDTTYEQLIEFSLSDIILYLPGGYGTFNELFYLINSYALREIDGKIIIYNMHHYFDNVIGILDKIKSEKFASIFDFVTIVDNVDDLNKVLEKIC